MNWVLATFTFALIASSTLSLAAAIYLLREYRTGKIIAAPCLLLLTGAGWAFSYACELASTSLEGKLFWASFQFVNRVLVPIAFFLLAVLYTGREKRINFRWLIPVLLPVAAIYLLGATNPLHHIVWQEARLVTARGFPMLERPHGIALYAYSAYSYLLIGLGLAFAVRAGKGSGGYLLKRHYLDMVIFAGVAGIVNILELSGLRLLGSFQTASLLITIFGFIIVWDVVRWRRADMLSISRRIVLDSMSDRVYVLDEQHRVVDANKAAVTFSGAEEENILGKELGQICPVTEPLDLDALSRSDSQHSSLECELNGEHYTFDITVNPILIWPNRAVGQVIVMRDITAISQVEKAEKEHETFAQALRKISAALNSTLDIERVLDLILENVGEVFAYDGANILELHNGKAHVVRSRGYEVRGVKDWLHSLVFNVAETPYFSFMSAMRKPICIIDTQNDPRWIQYPQTGWIRSHICAPIIVSDMVIGFIELDSEKPGFFDDKDAENLLIFAEQSGMAISNARIYESEREQRLLSEALRDTASIINSTLSLEDVFDRILTHIETVVPHDAANIMMFEGDTILIADTRGYEKFGSSDWIRGLQIEKDMFVSSSLMYLQKRPQLITDVAKDPDWIPIAGSGWIRSNCGAPIIVDDQVIGFLHVDSAKPNTFDERDAERLQAFADQAAIAIRNARLYAESEKRNQQLAAINRVTQIANTVSNLETMARELATTIAGAIGADTCHITLWDEATLTTIPLATSDENHEAYSKLVLEPGSNTFTKYMVEHGEAIAIYDALKSDVISEQIRMLSSNDFITRGLLAAPLQMGDRTIGAVLVIFRDARGFSEDEVNWIEQSSELIALAIARLKAYSELERRVEERTAQLSEANQQLTRLTRLKDEFVANVSHELRTPIANIKLHHHLLTANPQKQDIYLDRLNRETKRLEYIVEDLLFLSRMDRHEIEIQRTPMNMNNLIEITLADRELLAEKKNIQLTMEIEPGLPEIAGDTMLMGRVLDVLLNNALNYSPPGSAITLRTATRITDDQEWVTVSIQDTGPGIPPDEQGRLFERFFRGAAARSTGAPGTGLGLATAQEIVQRHGGRLELANPDIQNGGACFEIWLPARQEENDGARDPG
nr:GAF domain-containing protein [Anaerolineae bacterium]